LAQLLPPKKPYLRWQKWPLLVWPPRIGLPFTEGTTTSKQPQEK
jgi:hypothetical protein